MDIKGKILVVDDDASIVRSFQKLLLREGYEVETAENGVEGYEKAVDFKPQLILTDLNMPKMDGLELLEKLKDDFGEESPLVIAVTAYGDMDAAVKAMKLGAYDFLSKPIPLDKLRLSISRSFEKINMQEKLAFSVTDEDFRPGTIIGRSPSMVEVYKAIASLSDNRATALIIGESGTGKELVARAVHKNGPGSDDSFVAINCAAIPENLLESELVGYRKGSFTGADRDREGKLDAVGDGTLFLDEISEMSFELQAKMLRILQEREYCPIGCTRPRQFRGRIVAATNRNLEDEVASGNFREDLYYRLKVVTVSVPPLRDRMVDLDLLVSHFIAKVNRTMHTEIRGITREALDFLGTHSWPGNVRELENSIVKAAIGVKNHILSRDSLDFLNSDGASFSSDAGADQLFEKLYSLKDIEKRYIDYVLKASEWHKGKSSSILGITRPTLDKKIEEYGLKKDV